METNTCNVNYLDADSHLPPRKRLLAGFKRQSSDVNSPAPSTSSSTVSECNTRLTNLLRAQLSNPNLSNEEIAEASKFAAMEAANAAKAARANAEEKAAKAAKAVAAAKNALELVATLSEDTAGKEISPKKNKMKKHVPVQALYNKKKGSTNCRTDEELARNLHRVINSSPRILKNSDSDVKNQKHKRLKRSTSSGKNSVHNVAEGSSPSIAISNGNGVVGGINTEGPIKEIDMITVDLNGTKADKGDKLRINGEKLQPNETNQLKLSNGEVELLKISQLKLKNGEVEPLKTDHLKLKNGEVEPIPSKSKLPESLDSPGKKRGRMKQKKLPLSICNFRDQTSPKEEAKSRGMSQLGDGTSTLDMGNQPLFSAGPSGSNLVPVEKTTMWKCQAFKAPPACVKQNKVMQS